MADGGSTRTGGCIRTGKIMYESEGEARAYLREQLRHADERRFRRQRRDKDSLSVFYCGTCARWHIGSKWKR
jgi:hypothetical protein